ncbi:MAG: hypothetical protein QOK28_613 [Actinomycetota bacterium]
MDVRLSAEQRALRDAAEKLAAGLAPRSVRALDDDARRVKLETAVAATGWRELLMDASAIEAAVVVEVFGRALVDVPFIGPLLGGPVAHDAAGPDLTGALAGLPDDADLAIGLVLTSADLVGVMQGALDLAVEYAKNRHQYGAAVGSYQAVQHLLSDALVATEGSRSVALHAAWAVGALAPDDALAAAATAKAYCSRAARDVCETSIQIHGGIGNTWECLAHVYLRRALASIDAFGGVGPNLERVLAHGLR